MPEIKWPASFKFGPNDRYASVLRAALFTKLAIPASKPGEMPVLTFGDLFSELSRRERVSITYVGENYGYIVRVADMSSLAFLRVFSSTYGLQGYLQS